MQSYTNWQVTDRQQEFAEAVLNNATAQERYQRRLTRNVNENDRDLSRENYWKGIVMCVLTTQLRSGKGSNVHRLLHGDEFPLALERYAETAEPAEFTYTTLSDHDIGWTERKASHIAANYDWFQQGGFKYLTHLEDNLRNTDSDSVQNRIFTEIQAALAIQEFLDGIKYKQSRNFWQWLGLFRWETPLDSRVLNWLDTVPDIPGDVAIEPSELDGEQTYRHVMSWLQALAVKVDTYPCLLDAAIFDAGD